jgi:hypothetical protein
VHGRWHIHTTSWMEQSVAHRWISFSRQWHSRKLNQKFHLPHRRYFIRCTFTQQLQRLTFHIADIPTEFCGNLCVFPRSHHVLEKYFKENGFDVVKKKGLESLPYLPISQPVQITGKPGDVIIAHYQVNFLSLSDTS